MAYNELRKKNVDVPVIACNICTELRTGDVYKDLEVFAKHVRRRHRSHQVCSVRNCLFLYKGDRAINDHMLAQHAPPLAPPPPPPQPLPPPPRQPLPPPPRQPLPPPLPHQPLPPPPPPLPQPLPPLLPPYPPPPPPQE